ncbi:related to U4/U6 small nuclear ribonucleoprotein hPrp3 [Cephalotrichum gorgonifer]|uniref:Related to U4/U6 small nuclear ribonucleoprotein hPrp3 n=1 Tax=Cephalotrichum gorgonifer TaxID=2041049 RepID=A0AAE8N5N3_9PEZI|nr:related to U4/U6 small nuclear ribonucleoprotein hPrp3 [Cephalotrichum gorgonifer]
MNSHHQSDSSRPRSPPTNRVQKMESATDKMAALKARVAAAIGSSKAKGGLNVGLHPALEDLGTWKAPGQATNLATDTSRSTRPDRATQANRQLPARGPGGDVLHNPYLAESREGQAMGSKTRQPRQLVFNQKGKYIQQANALRRQAALEAMKKRIAEQSRKAGIDDELDVEKNFVISTPPSIEWWDEALLVDKDYTRVDDPMGVKLSTPDTILTEYIQHPVPIEPPQDQNTPAPKPMYLTHKEQKKLRRQRRMADLKERQAKERLGLIPAPPPKVKKANLMRVLGEEAVKDPTAVEARVNREIMERKQQHLEANEERKLTKEQRHEKIAASQERDAAKGVHLVVFRVESLANGQHRFKINKNAEQLSLTGVCIMHPKFNLVVAEGGEQGIRQYRKLMTNRIDWTENVPSRQHEGQNGAMRHWLRAEDEGGSLKDLSLNEIKLVFEGQVKARAFKKWGSRVCETDAEVREVLSRHKMENFWSLAKSIIT